jgi:hypothetical protein
MENVLQHGLAKKSGGRIRIVFKPGVAPQIIKGPGKVSELFSFFFSKGVIFMIYCPVLPIMDHKPHGQHRQNQRDQTLKNNPSQSIPFPPSLPSFIHKR